MRMFVKVMRAPVICCPWGRVTFETFQVYVDSQKAYGDGVPYHAQWIELEPVVKEHIQRAVKGEATVDQALKDLQTAMELAMKTAAETFKG